MKPVRLGHVLLPPVTALVLGVLVACFIVGGLVANFVPSMAGWLSYLPVTSSGVLHGEVWRLFTYALLHDLSDPFHLLFNGLSIFFFGRDLEQRWGTARSLVFLVASVVLGGAFVVAAGALHIGTGAALGASAYALALWVAWGLTFRDRQFLMYFAIPVKGIHAVWLALFFWVLDAVSTNGVSAAAHLGGIVAAFVLVRGVWRPNAWKAAWASLLERLGLKKKPKLFVVPGPKNGPGGRWVN
jgi:membrane associated rhomboid family serine protease